MIQAVAFDFGHTLVDERLGQGPVRTMPGVPQTLAQIDLPMAVWANTRSMGRTELLHKLDAAGLRRYFSCVITSVDAGFRKPARGFFEFALANWSYGKEEVLFVCNQLNTDVSGAKACGIQTAWLSAPEFRSADETMGLSDVTPTYILAAFDELPCLLNEISRVRASG